jgi:DNA-directed RNA polymerase subunit L
VKVSADRVLYLSRVILRKLKDNMNLVQKADDETARRAIQRALGDSYKELDEIEQKVEAALSKRKNVSPRDLEYLKNQRLEDEFRKHGA